MSERSWARVQTEGGISNAVFADLAYRIEYSPDTDEHLQVLTARQRKIVFDAVDEQLVQEPSVETRNRKPMRPNPVAPWELCIGTLWVCFETGEESDHVVTILAVGVKNRDRNLKSPQPRFDRGKKIEL